MSRTRTQKITSSLLGKNDGLICCPRRIVLGLKFEDTHPVHCLEAILAAAGFKDPEELRPGYPLPQGRLICTPQWEPVQRIPVTGTAHREVLEQALLLGLCTAQLFDPTRPVMWTFASLTRTLELFDPAGFYV
jgi:hypothetical protein